MEEYFFPRHNNKSQANNINIINKQQKDQIKEEETTTGRTDIIIRLLYQGTK